jgi:hypothetical protein
LFTERQRAAEKCKLIKIQMQVEELAEETKEIRPWTEQKTKTGQKRKKKERQSVPIRTSDQ